jgi:hypothetical protein
VAASASASGRIAGSLRRAKAGVSAAATRCSLRSVDVAAVLAECASLHPREAVQELTRAVVAACGGELRDDATVLCLDWHGGPPRDRDASARADR